ncbi:methylated-DNA--protein-cysteine methyltransferase [Nycticebus coucang]|uniref:methylated-DNA--protein-cysteine methyltransferase n=1 Tax=Nycticebus coucang TaxID=9470 RepID=UPI00234C2089|nr:methylated-DNA--protein-cysteine methyltransferase [Nycticebus coucang]
MTPPEDDPPPRAASKGRPDIPARPGRSGPSPGIVALTTSEAEKAVRVQQRRVPRDCAARPSPGAAHWACSEPGGGRGRSAGPARAPASCTSRAQTLPSPSHARRPRPTLPRPRAHFGPAPPPARPGSAPKPLRPRLGLGPGRARATHAPRALCVSTPAGPGGPTVRYLSCVLDLCEKPLDNYMFHCRRGPSVFRPVLGRMDKPCEVKYTMLDSPLGKIKISGCEQGLHGIRLPGEKVPRAGTMGAPALAEAFSSPEGVTEPLRQCAAWLDAYFQEPMAIKELPLPALHHPIFQQDSFTRQVLWKLLKAVKFGETVSYQQLAALAGNPRAARAVGGAMRSNPVPILIPCHRVVCSSGALGNYSGGGWAVKEWLLAHEGSRAGKPTWEGRSGPASSLSAGRK